MSERDSRAKQETYVGEWFIKAAQTILSTRIYQATGVVPKQALWVRLHFHFLPILQLEVVMEFELIL